MEGIALLLGLPIGIGLIISVFRISGNVRAIREHFDRVDRLYAEARVEKVASPFSDRKWVDGVGWVGDPVTLAPPTTQAVAETRKPSLHEREDATSRAYRAAHPDK
jgi:hypothetical protein